MRRQREWDGVGVWSSHPCKSPTRANQESFVEVLCLLHWDERLARAFCRAAREYEAAGSPGVPMNSVDYRKTFKA